VYAERMRMRKKRSPGSSLNVRGRSSGITTGRSSERTPLLLMIFRRQDTWHPMENVGGSGGNIKRLFPHHTLLHRPDCRFPYDGCAAWVNPQKTIMLPIRLEIRMIRDQSPKGKKTSAAFQCSGGHAGLLHPRGRKQRKFFGRRPSRPQKNTTAFNRGIQSKSNADRITISV